MRMSAHGAADAVPMHVERDVRADLLIPRTRGSRRRGGALPDAPDAAREEQTVLMTLAVVDWQYQEHGRENSWRVVDRSMVVFRVIDM